MQSRDFCYWLKGYLELRLAQDDGMMPSQVKEIENHLNMVFTYEIDPKMGGPEVQDKLNAIHINNNGTKMRC
jgi:hypothetical protein